MRYVPDSWGSSLLEHNKSAIGNKIAERSAKLVPDSWDSPLREYNQCHNPSGHPDGGGRFCSKRSGDTAQTRTPEFRKWFGDSIVVEWWSSREGKGPPKVVYHGTNRKDFDEFTPQKGYNTWQPFGTIEEVQRAAYFFSDSPKEAAGYAGGEKGARVIPVYLRLENPIDFRRGWHFDDSEEEEEFERKVEAAGFSPRYFRNIKPSEFWHVFDGDDGRDFVAFLKREGYDGALLGEHEKATTYVVFDPDQIKSAIGNRGTFSRKSNKITERG